MDENKFKALDMTGALGNSRREKVRKHAKCVKMPNPEGLEKTELYSTYEDFILSRQAMMVSATTIKFYNITAGRFVRWMVQQGKTKNSEITARDVRAYLNEFAERGTKESYVNGHARAIRTLIKFMAEEKYIPEVIKFKMPPTGEKLKLPYLTAEQVNKVLNACETPREKALILLMVDSGLRRAEIIAANWNDLDLKTGMLFVAKGKGGKSRSVVIGAKTRRVLINYKRTLDNIVDAPLFQTLQGDRFTNNGFRSIILRISKRAGVDFSPHALRRTFATLSLKAGMNPLHLQGLLGHTTLEMTRRYTQMVDDDLVEAHQKHGPVDNFIK